MSGKSRVWTVHIPPRAETVGRSGFIPDQQVWWERIIAFFTPFIWLIWRRNWLILIIYLITVPPLQYFVITTSPNSSQNWIDSAALMLFLAFSVLCAWQPAVVSRFDRRLRGWRYVWTVSARDKEEAISRWEEERESLE